MTEEQVVALFDQLQAEMVERGSRLVRDEMTQASGGVELMDDGDRLLSSSSVKAGVIAAISVLVERGVLKLEEL